MSKKKFTEDVVNGVGKPTPFYKPLVPKEEFKDVVEKDDYTRSLEERIEWLEDNLNIKDQLDEYKKMKLKCEAATAEAEYATRIAQNMTKAMENKTGGNIADMYGE